MKKRCSRSGSTGAARAGHALALLMCFGLGARPSSAQPAVLMSKGQPGVANSDSRMSVPPRHGASGNGQFFVFLSQATNLVPGQVDTNGGDDVFLYDRASDTVKLVSRSSADLLPFNPKQTGNGPCKDPVVSRDGNWVAFASTATDLVTGQVDTPATFDVFLWHATDGSIQLVSHANGVPLTAANQPSDRPSIFGDGSAVAYQSQATNLSSGFVNNNGTGRDIFRYIAGTNILVSHNNVSPVQGGNGDSFEPVINVGGGTPAIAFTSLAQNLVASQADTIGTNDVFVGNGGAIQLMSHVPGQPGTTGNAPSDSPSISDDGNFVAFHTLASDLISGPFSAVEKVMLADRSTPLSVTTLVSHAAGAPITSANASSTNPVISGDGLWVAFQSGATDLVTSQVDFNTAFDVFLFDVSTLTNRMVSHLAGTSATDKVTAASAASVNPEIDVSGKRVAFVSAAQNVAPSQNDLNGQNDVFVWDATVDAATVASRKAGTAATTGGGPPTPISDLPVLSGDGTVVAFRSAAGDLVTADTNLKNDVFLLVPTFTDLQVTKTSTPPAVPGAAFGYTVTVKNAGSVTVTGAIVTDPLPSTLTGATWSCSATALSSCTSSGAGDINDTVTLAPLGTLTYTISGTLSLFPPFGTIVNTATVFPPPAITDIDPTNDSSTTSDNLAPNAALTITHDDSPDPVFTNGTITYVSRITNNGPSATVELRLSVDIPGGATFISVDNPQCTFAAPTVSCVSPALGDLLPGESVVVTIVIQAPNVAGSITSVASSDSNTSGTVTATATTLVVDPAASFIEILTATSTDRQNTLEWRTPPPPASYDHTKIVFKTGSCPTGPTDGTPLAFVEPGLGAKGIASHAGLVNGTTYCYAAFVARDAAETLFSVAKLVKARPFDSVTGPGAWDFATGATAVVPPGLGGAGVYVPSNDRALYAVGRGASGGIWLPGYTPLLFNAPVQSRPPVVPIAIGAATQVTFVSSQDGNVFAVDANLGDANPTNAAPDPIWPRNVATSTQAAPAGWFQGFGGAADWNFIGTRIAGDNVFHALDARTGLSVVPNGSFDNGGAPNGIGIISGGAAVDYTNKRVYFTSRVKAGGSTGTAWCLLLDTTAGSEGIVGPCWSQPLGDIDYGPVLRNDIVFVAPNTGQVNAVDAITGVVKPWSFALGGLPKGFVVVDRTNDDLYVTGGGTVFALTYNVPIARWTVGSIPGPSQPVFVSIGASSYVFVGSSNGKLYQIDAVTGGSIKSVVLGNGSAPIGAPSFDGVNNMIYIGSTAGVVHAVRVPLP